MQISMKERFGYEKEEPDRNGKRDYRQREKRDG
jgi:hypothetical protein